MLGVVVRTQAHLGGTNVAIELDDLRELDTDDLSRFVREITEFLSLD